MRLDLLDQNLIWTHLQNLMKVILTFIFPALRQLLEGVLVVVALRPIMTIILSIISRRGHVQFLKKAIFPTKFTILNNQP